MDKEFVCGKLEELANPDKALHLARFFKIGPGQYGEGDRFWGITVPQVRAVAKEYQQLALEQVAELIKHEIHEIRLCALLILVLKFKQAKAHEQAEIINIYLRSTPWINNWDLVDLSAQILGKWLLERDRQILYELAVSTNIWEQRIAVVGTYILIKHGQFTDTLNLCAQLIEHKHDLMHKAMGWMLREVGKKDRAVLIDFLEQYWSKMPRTMFRYALEHFSKEEYQIWLKRGKS